MKQIMRITILALILISNIGFSQKKVTELKFDTKYFNAVDKWVAFPKKDKDSTYVYGFIYLDNQAGFTFNYETKFQIKEQELINIKRDSIVGLMKYRLEPNTSLVSVLTENQISALNLPKEPEWLSIYKERSDQVDYLKKEGYHFNHVGASDLALEPLLKAYEIDPHFDGLEFELSYAYNHLGQYEKAIPILEKAIENNPENYYFYRELGFSYVNLNKIDEAEKTYRKGIKMSDNDFEKSEMAVNMAQAYFKLKNKKKFDEWAELTRKYAKENSQYVQYIDHFELNWNKK
ncbi:tetratricopeptide repeat protein [Flavobacteriaceae bacterium 14752]|uniref:tetratricopeptide repeat protein n=1 Tax=Mesohalobacter salilacus TaxID=2491711 RepID=UPI000F63E79F|nr:tetratricopeptide repeat protein [Flavobacteriaceae bacterium 14752]